jgi:NAD(P)-dependent dehydrogenase (short-subunit alcohol dehydrogenase family)
MALFANRIMLVVGGARGMGRATALALAREGATVVVSDRLESGAETARLIEEAGGKASFMASDIGDERSVDALFASIRSRFGRLDGAFNAAAIALPPHEFVETPVAVWDDAFRVNARGTFLCMQHELRIMKPQRSGAVVTVASGAGLLGARMAAAYTASKHAVVGLCKTAALDMAPYGVRVNCLCPGTTRTEMIEQWFASVPGAEERMSKDIPLGRLAIPQDMAAAALWLLSDAAAYVTGQSIVVDGGLMTGVPSTA